MENNQKIILDLYAGTGAATDEYAAAGYARLKVTLPDNDVLTWQPPAAVYGIWASPPCTEWSLAKANLPRDFAKAIKEIKAIFRIVWQCQLASPLRFWCIENPTGFLRQFIGKPALKIHYWEYGDILDKPTDLWGYFNFPRKVYTEPPKLLLPITNMPGNGSKTRAITPPAFAKAFYQANQ